MHTVWLFFSDARKGLECAVINLPVILPMNSVVSWQFRPEANTHKIVCSCLDISKPSLL